MFEHQDIGFCRLENGNRIHKSYCIFNLNYKRQMIKEKSKQIKMKVIYRVDFNFDQNLISFFCSNFRYNENIIIYSRQTQFLIDCVLYAEHTIFLTKKNTNRISLICFAFYKFNFTRRYVALTQESAVVSTVVQNFLTLLHF